MERPRFRPQNRVEEIFARMVTSEARTAAARKKQENKANCRINVEHVIKTLGLSPSAILVRYEAIAPKGKRGMEELLAEGHGFETAPMRYFADVAGIHPPALLMSSTFQRDWKPEIHPPAISATDKVPSDKQVEPNDLEAEMARAVLETAIERGHAKKVRKIIEALVD